HSQPGARGTTPPGSLWRSASRFSGTEASDRGGAPRAPEGGISSGSGPGESSHPWQLASRRKAPRLWAQPTPGGPPPGPAPAAAEGAVPLPEIVDQTGPSG